MATLQCGAHGIDVADAFERIVHTAISHVDDDLLNRRAVRLRADKIRRAQALRHCEFLIVGIDSYESTGFCHHQTLDDTQTDAGRPKTAAVEPGLPFAVFSTAPIPVVIPHPSRQTFFRGAAELILATAISGTTVYSETSTCPCSGNPFFPLSRNATCHPASRLYPAC
jgi:hypothetical protein